MTIKAVSFDFWSTLFVMEEEKKTWFLARDRMLHTLNQYGLEVKGEQLLKCFREVMAICFDRQEHHGLEFAPEEQLEHILNRLGAEANKEMFENLYQDYTTTLLDIPPRLMEGAADVLEELANGYPLALICNTGRTPGLVVREIMKNNGILDRFSVLHFSNELGIAKPNPQIYKLTLEKLGCVAGEVVHIGDNSLTDVWGSRSVGMKGVWFNWRKEDKDVDCDLEIDTLKGLKEKLVNLG